MLAIHNACLLPTVTLCATELLSTCRFVPHKKGLLPYQTLSSAYREEHDTSTLGCWEDTARCRGGGFKEAHRISVISAARHCGPFSHLILDTVLRRGPLMSLSTHQIHIYQPSKLVSLWESDMLL